MFSALKLHFCNSVVRSAVNYYRQPKFGGPFSALTLKMSSKRICSSFSNSKPQMNALEATSGKSENCEDIEEMILNQIKSRLSSDVAAKGSKRGLVSDLKSTTEDEGSSAQDEKMAAVTKTFSKKKAKELPESSDIQISNRDSNTSGVQTRKRRAKQSSIDATDLKTLQSTSEQELVIDSIETKEKTLLRGKRKASARVSTSTKVIMNVDPPVEEPWTVLTHKRPQEGWNAYILKPMLHRYEYEYDTDT